MIDNKPAETEYSLNSMVLYTLPLSGGAPKAANAKTRLNPMPPLPVAGPIIIFCSTKVLKWMPPAMSWTITPAKAS